MAHLRWIGADQAIMRAPTTIPTGIERVFDKDDIIVSKTDAKGIIRYANDVFLRVSGYDEAALIGQPHSIIRHPDMPRCVFRLLWKTIAAGDEIFAYINNLAADGANYWVYAHVTPSFGPRNELIGYHSNRRLPDRRAIELVTPIYAALLAQERRHTQTPAAIEASTVLLHGLLRERGQTYDQFVWSLASTGVGSVGLGSTSGAL